MLYDNKQMSQREALYTVLGALVLAVILFVLLVVHEKTRTGQSTDASFGDGEPYKLENENDTITHLMIQRIEDRYAPSAKGFTVHFPTNR